jgi:hypothetical protein
MDAAGDHQAADLTVELDGGQVVAGGGDPAPDRHLADAAARLRLKRVGETP